MLALANPIYFSSGSHYNHRIVAHKESAADRLENLGMVNIRFPSFHPSCRLSFLAGNRMIHRNCKFHTDWRLAWSCLQTQKWWARRLQPAQLQLARLFSTFAFKSPQLPTCTWPDKTVHWNKIETLMKHFWNSFKFMFFIIPKRNNDYDVRLKSLHSSVEICEGAYYETD